MSSLTRPSPMSSPWEILEEGFDPEPGQAADRRGNKLLVGNGYIGYRGTLEEFDRLQKTATIVSGLYDQVGSAWREPVNLPNGAFIQVHYQGEVLHALKSKVLAHAQSLDLRAAVHQRQTVFEAADGTRIRLRARRFASLARWQLLCQEFSVSADRECEIEIQAGVDGDTWDLNGPHLRQLEPGEADGILSVSAVTHENAVPVAVVECAVFPQPARLVGEVTFTHSASRSMRHFRLRCTPEAFTFYKFSAHCTGLDETDPLQAAYSLCRAAAAAGFERLLAEHTARWSERWEDCDILIEGDPEAQQALRFSMYHLLSIVPTHSDQVSIPARGMSGQMYKGAIFWDTEIFMLPFFIHTFPHLARNLLRYRCHALDGARRKARQYGFRGAFYAWESQDAGDDACTLFNITDVFTNRPMRTYFRDKQVHISGDIAHAFWQYYDHTGDESIWLEGGAEVVFECARFYLSYLYYHPDRRRYEVLDVTGPDEYHERVHNNAFTNRMVGETFAVCLQVAALLRQHQPQFLETLLASLAFEADLEAVARVAPALFQPDEVAAGGMIAQFDGYFSLTDVPLSQLLSQKLNPNEYLGGGNGLATTTQIVKQADVVLMLYLFGERYPQATKAANWEYYEPRTEHGSSLSACSYSILAAQLGKVDWAYRYFMRTATIDLAGEGKQYVGTLYIGGTHPAGNGGAWMAAVFGLCGVRCADGEITARPHLPAHWKKVSLPLVYRGQKVRLNLTGDVVTILKS